VNARIKGWIFGRTPRPRRIRFGLLRGWRFVVDPLEKSQRLVGLDEREIAPSMRAAAAHSRTAIDVGAHDGWYSTFFASRPNISRVIACDRNARVMDRLLENVRLNGLAGKVDVCVTSVGRPGAPGCRSLDDLLTGEAPPFVIKVDVDGGEADVLAGGATVLREQDCSLIVETHSVELERACIEYLRGLGYDTTVIPNGWYRRFVSEMRPTAHNRWFVASRSPH
jgi:predicted RNA methylase